MWRGKFSTKWGVKYYYFYIMGELELIKWVQEAYRTGRSLKMIYRGEPKVVTPDRITHIGGRLILYVWDENDLLGENGLQIKRYLLSEMSGIELGGESVLRKLTSR